MSTILTSPLAPIVRGGRMVATHTPGAQSVTVVSPTLLAASQPGSPQVSSTLTSGQLPSSPGFVLVQQWLTVWIFGQNTDTVSRSVSFQFRKSGFSGTSGGGTAIPAGEYYAQYASYSTGFTLVAGDVIELFFWANAANVVNYEWVGWQIITGAYNVPSGRVYSPVWTTQQIFPTTSWPGGSGTQFMGTSINAADSSLFVSSNTVTTVDLSGTYQFPGSTANAYLARDTSSVGSSVTNAVKASVNQQWLTTPASLSYFPVRNY